MGDQSVYPGPVDNSGLFTGVCVVCVCVRERESV